ncbi:peptide deformylase [Roseospira navarrensis]|uniref:Peptide deformylase n=1 Tax=Roseospira navarrensis TaxID=140058 RepID=A0A7X1ZBH5_9PROT|nr:peptide deformylase [Roseospira navarrensis]MQX35486.1 peptide deformylase [Roseospira navarrensis]
MSILKIARMGHPVLAAPAAPVADPTAPAVRRLLADMVETLRDIGGVGLAAPQVHEPWRVVIYEVPAARNDGEGLPLRALINPVLEPLDPDGAALVEDWEACLSLPGLTGRVPRHAAVRFRGLDAAGRAVDGEARGFHARVLQHECDHLDGVLYPMRMRDLSAFGFVEAMRARPASTGDAAARAG